MVNQVKMFLQQDEFSALLELALKEMRNPTEQARFILRQEFERRGLLKPDPSTQAVKLSQPMQASGEGAQNANQ